MNWKLLLSLLIACSVLPMRLPLRVQGAETQPVAVADRTAVVEGDNAFAVALYGHLRGHNGNLFFSPESISPPLAVAYDGARGATATAMAKTLHFKLAPERLRPAKGALLSDLNATHEGYHLSVANALRAQ